MLAYSQDHGWPVKKTFLRFRGGLDNLKTDVQYPFLAAQPGRLRL